MSIHGHQAVAVAQIAKPLPCTLPCTFVAPSQTARTVATGKSSSVVLPFGYGSSLVAGPAGARGGVSMVVQGTEQTNQKTLDDPVRASVVGITRIFPRTRNPKQSSLISNQKPQFTAKSANQPSQAGSDELSRTLFVMPPRLPIERVTLGSAKVMECQPSTPVTTKREFLQHGSGGSHTATTASGPPSPKSPVRSFCSEQVVQVVSKTCQMASSTAQGVNRRSYSRSPDVSNATSLLGTAVIRMSTAQAQICKTSSRAARLVNPREKSPRSARSPERASYRTPRSISPQARARHAELAWQARMCFLMYDTAGRGWLDFHQLVECLHHLGDSLNLGHFTTREAGRFFRRFDADRDQHLNRAEFERLYQHLHLISRHTHEPTTFNREMLISRREGHPSLHYYDLDRLGDGAFGSVKKVACKQTGSERVIKTVDIQLAMKSGMPADIVMEEIDRLKRLDHPAILRLFEYYVGEKSFHLVMDLLPQGDLLQALVERHWARSPWDESWIADIFRQMCEGIAYAHAKGVMHKDVKLDNVMLCSVNPPQAVVIDVGLAEIFPPNEASTFRSEIRAGCKGTMAPEVLMENFSCKCDVWSLGCCLYGLFVKKPIAFRKPNAPLEVFPYPFSPPVDDTTNGTKELLRLQREGANLEKCRGSEDCHDLIRLMLTYDDASRPSMREVLEHEWLSRHFKRNVHFTRTQLESLVNISKMSALEEAVLLDVSTKISIVQLHELSRLFAALDTVGDGQLEESNFVSTLREAGLGADVAQTTTRKMARNGKIEFSRFAAAFVPSGLLRDGLRGTFTRHADVDGFIGKEELKRFVRCESVEMQSTLDSIGDGCHIDLQGLTHHFESFAFEESNSSVTLTSV